MNLLQSLILGALQGITEFLPISSDGHLVLAEIFLKLKTELLKSFDVTVHMGTFLAILIYFWKDVWQLLKTFFGLFIGKSKWANPYTKLIAYIVVGTIPAVIAGVFFGDWIDEKFRNLKAVATLMIIMGTAYYAAEAFYSKYYSSTFKGVIEKAINKIKDFFKCEEGAAEIAGLNFRKAIIIGIAQSLALLPGVSRSGSTIAAGLFQGIERSQAARFSFLLGLPAILGAGIFTFIKNSDTLTHDISAFSLIIGFITSFIFGLFSIAILMKLLKKYSLNGFAVYLVVIGGAILLN
jgi:undecaprenyl-diphosphatase